jgi:NDP-sugar pyrophosphorylase family protein
MAMQAGKSGVRSGLAMVMPMAGRGSRFARNGENTPKPLIDLHGRPFFWWATESLRRAVPVEEMVFVVLAEHCREHAIGEKITEFYPQAKIIALDEVTSGAAETAAIGARALASAGPVAFNDCDHAFVCPDISAAISAGAEGALLCFRSRDPAYSYARVATDGRVAGTVEKQVVSPFAIAGCYFFAGPEIPIELYGEYARDCPYDERFVSGLYNVIAARGGGIAMAETERHISFGTPEDFAALDLAMFATAFAWH